MNNPLVSVIVPTYNSSKNLKIFLESFLNSNFKNFEIIVNEDKRTSDDTEILVKKYRNKGLKIIYLLENKLMAQARKKGAEYSSGRYLIHLDSDMKISKDLLSECIELIESDYDALVIPEESYGTTFWAKCKWLEKKCYNGVTQIESLRFLKKEIYNKLGGHDERMVFSEDKDFDLRVRQAGYRVGRTKNIIYHNEGEISLISTLRKKRNYVHSADIFAEKHPREFRWQINIFNRYVIYFKNIKYFLFYPMIFLGMLFMKTCEFLFGAFGLLAVENNKQNININNKIKEKDLPYVSFIIPTLNAEEYLKKCLDSIFVQDYPKDKIEVLIIDGGSTDCTLKILKNYPVTLLNNPKIIAEYGKVIGIKQSKGDYFILLDSDNEIVENYWLREMVRPILENSELFGVESALSFDSSLDRLNRYFARLRIADPLARILTSKPIRVNMFKGYKIPEFKKGSILITGANGFLWNKKILKDYDLGEKFEEANFATFLYEKTEISYAMSENISVRHYYCKSLREYLIKRKKIAIKVKRRLKNKEYVWVKKNNPIKIFFSIIYLGTFIGPLFESIYKNIKYRTFDYIYHPIVSFLTIYIYGWNFIKTSNNFKNKL